MTPYDDRPCQLGEGPLWHPEREQLFWFDIIAKRLLTRTAEGPTHWQFDEYVSAAGWVDRDTLLIASQSALFRFDLNTGTRQDVCALEADNAITRSNDGRADRQGGFWIGTMGINAEPAAGAIYRYFKGELRCVFPDITISNAICFAPDGRTAYFTDTVTGIVNQVALDSDGWPCAAPRPFLDMTGSAASPDGAVTDAAGNLWQAEWGGARVACYSPDGQFVSAATAPTDNITCPAFGGSDLRTLFFTTARQGLNDEELTAQPLAGQTLFTDLSAPGLPEPKVLL